MSEQTSSTIASPSTEGPPAVDTLLAAFGCATVPEGIVQRVASNMAAGVACNVTAGVMASASAYTHFPAQTQRSRFASRFVFGALGVGAVACVAVVMIFAAHRQHVPLHGPVNSEVAAASPLGAPAVESSSAPPFATPAAHATTVASPSAASTLSVGMQPAPLEDPLMIGEPNAELAAAEMRAPSLTAPPLPLTGDERKAKRLALQRDAYEVARLTSDAALAARERLDRATYEHYFAPLPEPTGNGPLVAMPLDKGNSFEPAPQRRTESSTQSADATDKGDPR